MTDRTDTFIRANTTTNIGTPSDGGSDWVQLSGTWGIVGNAGYKSATSGVRQVAYLESSVSDVDVQATLGTINNATNTGLAGRIADDNNYILLDLKCSTSVGEIKLFKKVAGSYTQFGSTISGAVTAGDVFKLRMNGSSLTVYQNGALKLSATDSAGLTNTKHGLGDVYDNAENWWTAFSITGVGAPPVASSAKTIFIMP